MPLPSSLTDAQRANLRDNGDGTVSIRVVNADGTAIGVVGSGVQDESTFTEATSTLSPVGGVFNDTLGDVTSGLQATARITRRRAVHSNLRDSAGSEIGTTANPVQVTQAALARTIDAVSAGLQTDALMFGTTVLTPAFAPIAAASSGDNTLLAAVSGRQIRVIALAIVAGGANNLYFTSGAGGTVIFAGSTNKIQLAANGIFILPFNPLGWFQNSAVTQALVMNLSAATSVSGGFVYVTV